METMSATENRVLMAQAREALSGKWGLAVGTYFLYMLIGMAVRFVPRAGWIGSLLIMGPMTLGLAIFALSLSRNQNARLEQVFQ